MWIGVFGANPLNSKSAWEAPVPPLIFFPGLKSLGDAPMKDHSGGFQVALISG